MKKNFNNNVLKSVFLSGIYILLFIFFNIFISSVLFIFHISISKYTVLVSFGLSSLVIWLFLRKSGIGNFKYIIASIVIPIVVILGTIYVNGKIIDSTWDGNSYHKVTIGMLKNGWNPLYEEMNQFDARSESPVFIKRLNSIWGSHYAKASHIFAANIYALTNNIECGKCINSLSIIMLFLIVIALLIYYFKKLLFPLLFGICIITLPVICSQYLTFYVDLLVYIYLMIIIVLFFSLEMENFVDRTIILIVYFCSLVIAINIKFSLFGYVGLFCLGYYILYIIRLKHQQLSFKRFLNFTIYSFFAVIVGVFIVGLCVYPKNFLDHGHPFYPLMGKGRTEIMINNQPDYFKEKNSVEKFMIATFSKMDNITESSGKKAEYKLPFSIYDSEFKLLSACDTRISGNGIFFSGILIIAVILFSLTVFRIYHQNGHLFWLTIIPIVITVIMIFCLSESWWARYFPQIYFLIFAVLLYLNEINDRKVHIVLYLFIILILINSFLIFWNSTKYALNYTKEVNNSLWSSDFPYDCKLSLYAGISSPEFPGAIYNVFDKRKNLDITILDSDEYEYIPGMLLPVIPPYVVGKCE